MEEELYDLDILAIIKTNNGREYDIIKGDNQFKQRMIKFCDISELMNEKEKNKFCEILEKRSETDKFFYTHTKLTIDNDTYYGLVISPNDKAIYLLLLNSNVTKEPIYFKSLAKLNNELMITQKELYKKNIELQKLNKKLNEMLITEELTGLYNRRYFYIKIKEEIYKARRNRYDLFLISIDINYFKVVNDTYGHFEGDILLKKFAEITQKVLRRGNDYAFRVGGDEFLIILSDCSEEGAKKVAERLDKEFCRFTNIASLAYGYTKIEVDDGIENIEKYIKIADTKMYEYKNKIKSL